MAAMALPAPASTPGAQGSNFLFQSSGVFLQEFPWIFLAAVFFISYLPGKKGKDVFLVCNCLFATSVLLSFLSFLRLNILHLLRKLSIMVSSLLYSSLLLVEDLILVPELFFPYIAHNTTILISVKNHPEDVYSYYFFAMHKSIVERNVLCLT